MGKAAAMGTKLMVGTTPVGALKSIGGVKITVDTVDLTAMDNTDGYREFDVHLKDGGEVSVSGFLDYEDAGQKAMYAALDSGEKQTCSIVFPAKIGATWRFNAFVTGFETGAEMEDGVSFDGTLKVSGKPTLADTTPMAQQ